MTTTGVLQDYLLGGTASSSSAQLLQEMIINGYALDGEVTDNETPYKAIDMYQKYGIYMMYAKFYACAPNQNAATDIYNQVMADLNAYLEKQGN